MHICIDFSNDCRSDSIMLYTVNLYYVFVSCIIILQLVTFKKLFRKVPNSNELLAIKALKFALYQVLVFNFIGFCEMRLNEHYVLRIILLTFQLLSVTLINVLMIVVFCELKKNRKYDDVYPKDDDCRRIETERLELYFTRVQMAMIIFGMIYSAIVVAGVSIILKVRENYLADSEIKNHQLFHASDDLDENIANTYYQT